MKDDPQTRARFGTLLHGAMALLEKDLSDPVVKIWWNALLRFEIEDIESAFNRYFGCGEKRYGRVFLPSDIIRLIEGDGESAAMLAWSKVEKAIRMVGPWPTVAFDDPLIHSVISEMGGWILLCETTEKELPFKGKEFSTRYQGARMREENEYPSKLVGIVERDNYQHSVEAPLVLIGDRVRAEGVIASGVIVGLLTHRISRASELLKIGYSGK